MPLVLCRNCSKYIKAKGMITKKTKEMCKYYFAVKYHYHKCDGYEKKTTKE
jgi:hypothetical protein